MNKSEHVKNWRKSTKERIVKAMGGGCQCCGYNNCNSSLDLHHIDPTKKEFSFGKIIANPKSWAKIVLELQKCILVCRNCHGEIHAGVRVLPEVYSKFDEDFIDYRPVKILTKECCVCGKKIPDQNKTCSYKCKARLQYKINWDEFDLKFLLENYNYTQIGDIVGVSDVAVKKRAVKLGLVRGSNPTKLP